MALRLLQICTAVWSSLYQFYLLQSFLSQMSDQHCIWKLFDSVLLSLPLNFHKNYIKGIPWQSIDYDSAFTVEGACSIPSQELRSCKLCVAAKKKKKKKHKVNICIHTHTNATVPFPFGNDFKLLLGKVEKVAKLVSYLICFAWE